MKSASETAQHLPNKDRVLVIMAKAPRPGAVKTRLAPSLSPAAVTDFYCCLLADTLVLARSLGDVEVAIMCPDSDINELAQLAGSDAGVVAQKGEGLAAGLTSVFAHFAENHRRHTIAFNSDSPHLPRSVLENAFETLAERDVVVGPSTRRRLLSRRGKCFSSYAFRARRNGTQRCLESLLSRTRALELSVGFAPPFYDIDVAEDLTRWQRSCVWLRQGRPARRRGLKSGELAAQHSRTGSPIGYRTGTEKLRRLYPRLESVHTRYDVVRGADDLLLQLRRQRRAVLHGVFGACRNRVPPRDP